jgi:RNA polymerase sigma-70 factor (ECF subfamily)
MAASPTTSPAQESRLLAAAQRGDEQAFTELVDPHRPELHAHCYRMLGSLHDAEDALQESMLKAWRAIGRFEGRSSLRSWLYTIATNTCLNAISRRPKRVLPLDYGPSADPHDGVGEPVVESVWIEPYPADTIGLGDGPAGPDAKYELRESVELAFVAAMQHLPANQRAALILREVLGFSAKEVAEALETSVPSVNSALQRARKTIDERLPEHSQQETLRTIGDERLRELVDDFMDAMTVGDVDRVVSMLAEDAAWTMPPLATWFRGLPDVRTFLANGPLNGTWRWKRLPAKANGQVAVGAYTWRDDEQCFRPFAIDVLSFTPDGKVAEVDAFIARTATEDDREVLARFPDEPIDLAKAAATFEAFGLPMRLA